jgi:hypothetical protein
MRGSQMSAIFRKVNCGVQARVSLAVKINVGAQVSEVANAQVSEVGNLVAEQLREVTFGEVGFQPGEVPEPPRVDLNVQVPEPPQAAEFLVGLFAKKRYRNGLRQNLEEDFNNDIVSGMSIWRARSRYWSAALNSIGPQFWMFVKRIGLVTAFAEFARRLLH